MNCYRRELCALVCSLDSSWIFQYRENLIGIIVWRPSGQIITAAHGINRFFLPVNRMPQTLFEFFRETAFLWWKKREVLLACRCLNCILMPPPKLDAIYSLIFHTKIMAPCWFTESRRKVSHAVQNTSEKLHLPSFNEKHSRNFVILINLKWFEFRYWFEYRIRPDGFRVFDDRKVSKSLSNKFAR